jgi:hypothetical protein
VNEVPAGSAFAELTTSLGIITRNTAPLWYAAVAGAIALFRDAVAPRHALEPRCLAGSCALSIAPGFYFREHYFILLLPVLALFIGVAAGITRIAYCPASSAP